MTTRIPRRIFMSLLVVVAWFGFVIDGTYALFSSAATLTSNTINTGTAKLLVSNSQNPNSNLFETSRAGFEMDLIPGETVERYFLLKNASEGPIDFELGLLSNILLGGDAPHLITVGIYPVNDSGTVFEAGFSAALSELVSAKSTGLILPHGSVQRYVLRTTLSPEAVTQGAGISFDLSFHGNQRLAGS